MKRITITRLPDWKSGLLTALLALWTIAVFGLVPSVALGAVPQLINFQGILKDGSGNPVADGSYSVIFTIYDDPTAGTVFWAETTSVSTSSGLFTVLLGSTNPVVDSAFNGPNRWLGIKVGADAEMSPRQKLTSVGYTFRTEQWTSAAQDLFRLNGNVGIGTASPVQKLDVAGNIQLGSHLIFSPNAGEVVTTNGILNLNAIGGDLIFSRNGLEQARITSDGHLGIGTTSPVQKLDVAGNIQLGSHLIFSPNAGEVATTNGILNLNAIGGDLIFSRNGLEQARITSDGRLGIGTTSPFDLLHVKPGSSGAAASDPFSIAIFESGSNGYLSILAPSGSERGVLFGDNLNSDDGGIIYSGVDNRMDFRTNGNTNRMSITSAGSVGIGTTSPAARLHVKGAGFPSAFGYFDTDASGQDAGLRFQEAGVVKSHLYHQASTNTLNLYGEGFSGISVTSTGNVGIGTTAPTGAKLDVRGDIKLGSSGQFFATGGSENLRIIRGTIGSDGTIAEGSGFTVSHLSTGMYTITFGTSFPDLASIVASPRCGAPGCNVAAYVSNVSSAEVITAVGTGISDISFDFVVVGPK